MLYTIPPVGIQPTPLHQVEIRPPDGL